MASWMTPPTHDTDQLTPWSEGPRLVRQNAFMVESTEPYNPFDHINSTHSDESSISAFSISTFGSSVDDDTDDIENHYASGQRQPLVPLYEQRSPVQDDDTDIGNIENRNSPYYRPRRRIPLAPIYERRSPIPENTGDYDEPLPHVSTTTSNNSLLLSPTTTTPTTTTTPLLWPGMVGVLGIIIYQVCACTELKIMPLERLHTVDPSAPTHVWVPVFYWSCWNDVWFVRYRWVAALGVMAWVALYFWQCLKRRS